jgi:serine/threonine protein kinase
VQFGESGWILTQQLLSRGQKARYHSAALMGGDDSKLLRRLYAEALQRDPEERAEYLDAACRDRPDLRARVSDLLLAHADAFLDAAPAAESDGKTTFAGARPGSGADQLETRRIGDYVIRREIGRGGMGVVYLADDTSMQRRVALKALSPDLIQRPDLRQRLRNEARLAGRLSHPGIATIYDLKEINGELYMVCEFVPGTPLRELLKSGPVPIDEVVNIGLQLARALAEAHTLGIVHRDLKPENVIRTPSGVVKILDFGLALDEHGTQSRLTQTGVIVGTPAYLAPEQVRGEPADFRTDLFALGLLLYELASGVNPFVDKSLTGTIARIVEEDPLPLSTVQPRSVSGLDKVIEVCLRKEPAKRYSSTRELISNLESVLAEVGHASGSGRPPSYPNDTPTPGAPAPSPNPSPDPSPAQTARWLAIHQLVVSFVYIATLYPAWYARPWLSEPWGLVFVLMVLATAAAATSLRLHLWFTAKQFPGRFAAQHARTAIGARLCDLIFAMAQIAAAFTIGGQHPEFAMLFVAISAALLVVSFVIEPATAAAVGAPAQGG